MDLDDVDFYKEYMDWQNVVNENGVIIVKEKDLTNMDFKILNILSVLNLLDYLIIHDEVTLSHHIMINIKEKRCL